MSERNYVIVGAGLAGATAARTLREEGYDGQVTLIGSESHRPYLRPPLSKTYLAGEAKPAEVFVETPSWYAENDITCRHGCMVRGLDPETRTLSVDGESVSYDRLLLATGSAPRLPGLHGVHLPHVHVLRTLDDAAALHDQISSGDRRVVTVGAGWIGMEVAATARKLGNEVTVLHPEPVALGRQLGAEAGGWFASVHRGHGVTIRDEVTVAGIEPTGVRLGSGELVPADVVVIGIGASPRTELALSAGLSVDNGVLTDSRLQTSAPHIYAAGDIANAWHPFLGDRVRSEHWANALKGGRVAARTMLGHDVEHDSVPYFYSDFFDIGMEYSGFANLAKDATTLTRGDPTTGAFMTFWVADSRVVAAMSVNTWDMMPTVQALITGRSVVDLRRLADPTVPLEQVVATGAAPVAG